METHKGILILGEVDGEKLAPVTIELLGIGRKLSDQLNEPLGLLLMGEKIGGLGQEAIAYGADVVYMAEDPLLKEYNPDAYTEGVSQHCLKTLPSIVLLGHTDIGMDLAPRLNARLGGGLAMDCQDLTLDPSTKTLVMTRPIFGGNAYARTVSRNARPQMATVRPKTFPPALKDDTRKGTVLPVEWKVDPSSIKLTVAERIKEEAEGLKLEDAEVVVSGGAGIGGAQNFEMLWELARIMGGTVGATRRACDEGWVPVSLQIGQTGKVVSPKLYIAVALSGAMSHIVGCLGSKCIVAINKDPEANIFSVAHYGIVADYKEVLPALTAKLKELLSA